MKKVKMRIVNLVLFLCFFEFNIQAQDINYWYGELNISPTKLPITLKIEQKPDTTIILMGSPSQTNEMFGVTKQRLIGDSIVFSIKSMGLVFRGKYNDTKDTIYASFKQGFLSENLILAKTEKIYKLNRPQEPIPPYPYIEEEMDFNVKGVNYDFKGTLTLPSKDKKHPCLILVTGSGIQNRDEEVFGHKPFKVLADYLTKNGIAVFRYDDRGWGSNSNDSIIINATTLDYAIDAQAAFDLISNHPNIDNKNIGMLGHSEGGAIVSICASKNIDLKYIILLAGPGMKGIDVLLQQNKAYFEKANSPQFAINFQLSTLNRIYQLIETHQNDDTIEKNMNKWFDKELKKLDESQRKEIQFSNHDVRKQFVKSLTSNWMRTFMMLDPADYLEKVQQPVLAINGTNDIQVLYKYNLPAIEKALKKGNNNNFKIQTAEGMNHLFQESKSGMVDEYSQIEQTISPIILSQIKDFVIEHTN
jgi:pimeloyl-ACP methyl ester carboxylesterase